jgi:4-aminobutyrate aminotransferase-like enzyme
LDVIETRRDGIGFTDPLSERRMIDCFTSAGCFNVGKGNPVIQQALEETPDRRIFRRSRTNSAEKTGKMTDAYPEVLLLIRGPGNTIAHRHLHFI